jgi:hypothetical protein
VTDRADALIADDRGWLGRARSVIHDLGFSVVTDVDPANPAATELVVAVREEPTLRHFDPEVVAFWAPENGRSRPREVDRDSRMPFSGRYEWGRISIADRLGLTNQWLSFGGTVRAADLDDDTTVVLFHSPAPIQRWSGHSQGLDLLTPEMGAFFGRLMIPIDFEPGAEGRIVSTDPLVLYCAFVSDATARSSRSSRYLQADRPFVSWADGEARRLRAAEPAAWAYGGELLRALGVGG